MILFVPGPLPGLNELFAARGRTRQIGAARQTSEYARAKKRWSGVIALLVRVNRIEPIEPSAWTWLWVELHRRRDPDNFSAAGRKLVLDGLHDARVLRSDGWTHVLEQRDHWIVLADFVKRSGGSGMAGVFVLTSRVGYDRDAAIEAAVRWRGGE